MEQALVIGASGGIGQAVADALRARGARVTQLSRREDGLDVTDAASVDRHLAPLEGPFDLIFVATGALSVGDDAPEKALKAVSARTLSDLFAINAIGPALILRHAPRLLPRRDRAVFAALSARVGSIGDNALGGWYSYRASKAALNQIIRTGAIELARTHRQLACVALHPGTVATRFTADYQDRHDTVPPEAAAANLLRVIDGLTADHTGRFFDYSGTEVPW